MLNVFAVVLGQYCACAQKKSCRGPLGCSHAHAHREASELRTELKAAWEALDADAQSPFHDAHESKMAVYRQQMAQLGLETSEQKKARKAKEGQAVSSSPPTTPPKEPRTAAQLSEEELRGMKLGSLCSLARRQAGAGAKWESRGVIRAGSGR